MTMSVSLKRAHADTWPECAKFVPSRHLDLSGDCFLPIFDFLNPEEVALAERVSRAWQKTINGKNQLLWKLQYLSFFPEANILSGKDSGKIYKKLLAPIYGSIAISISSGITVSLFDEELICKMDIKLKLSTAQLQLKSPIGRENLLFEKYFFSQNMALRYFINPEDKNYKRSGDKIKALWEGRRLVLIFRSCDIIPFENTCIMDHVHHGIRMNRFTVKDLFAAQALAKACGEWVHLR